MRRRGAGDGLVHARTRVSALFAAAIVFAATLFALSAHAHAAYAEDGDLTAAPGSDNVVNTQQLPDSSFIYDTSLADLAGADSYYDNQTVQVVGEAVGDAVRVDLDDEHRWVTLGPMRVGEGAALSVFMDVDDTKKIDGFGKYGVTGTRLQVRGTFHLVCPEHGGITDLHADHVSVMAKSAKRAEPFASEAFVFGGVLVLVGAGLVLLFLFLRERQR